MTVPLRHPVVAARADPIQAFKLWAWARARLWQAGEIDLHDAVDVLQQGAIENGLVDAIGQDEAQRIMASAFAAVRDDLGVSAPATKNAAAAAWNAPSWRDAAIDYHKQRAGRTLIAETPPEHLKRVRALMADNVTLERAYAELNRPVDDVAASTLAAAEYLVREGDTERLRRWMNQHSARERQEILRHIERRRKQWGAS